MEMKKAREALEELTTDIDEGRYTVNNLGQGSVHRFLELLYDRMNPEFTEPLDKESRTCDFIFLQVVSHLTMVLEYRVNLLSKIATTPAPLWMAKVHYQDSCPEECMERVIWVIRNTGSILKEGTSLSYLNGTTRIKIGSCNISIYYSDHNNDVIVCMNG